VRLEEIGAMLESLDLLALTLSRVVGSLAVALDTLYPALLLLVRCLGALSLKLV
jgi:hypothetical protein